MPQFLIFSSSPLFPFCCRALSVYFFLSMWRLWGGSETEQLTDVPLCLHLSTLFVVLTLCFIPLDVAALGGV
jgi:hypothetical protein